MHYESLLKLVDEAKNKKNNASNYTIVLGKLYKRGLTTPMIKFITKKEVKSLMHEIHGGFLW